MCWKRKFAYTKCEVADSFTVAERKQRKEKGRSKIGGQMKHSCSFSGYTFIKHMFIKHLHKLGIMLHGTYAGRRSSGHESQIIPWLEGLAVLWGTPMGTVPIY